MTLFNYEKALAAVGSNEYARVFLETNRARLEELGAEAGMAALLEIVDLFAAGKNLEAWRQFYGKASWATLGQGAAEDVTNTADMAKRWTAVGAYLRETGETAAKALLAIVVAGFCA